MVAPHSSTDAVERARVNLLHAGRRREDLTELRAALAEAKIAAYVERVLSEAPALSADQRDRLAALLKGGSDG